MTLSRNRIPGNLVRGFGEKNQKLSSKVGQCGNRIDRGTGGAREGSSHRFDFLSVLGALEGLHLGVGEMVFLSFSTGDRAWDAVNPNFFKSCLHIKHGAKPISVSNDTRLPRLIVGSRRSDPRLAGEIPRGGRSRERERSPAARETVDAWLHQILPLKLWRKGIPSLHQDTLLKLYKGSIVSTVEVRLKGVKSTGDLAQGDRFSGFKCHLGL